VHPAAGADRSAVSAEALRVGVVGAGAMGASHARTLTQWVPGVQVTRVYDFDRPRAELLARDVGGASADSAEALIDAHDVDAVVIASPDRFHAEQVLACITASKPVLCEKPLAADSAGSRMILEAEGAAIAGTGSALVQVGFMRRFDPAYLALRAHVAAGGIGTARVVHCVHRNASSQTSTTSEGIVTGSMVHELDIVPWLLDDPVRAITVYGASGADPVQDPQVAVLELAGGAIATIEVFVNARYGYDVQCEVVGDEGTVALTPPYGLSVRTSGATVGVAGIQVADDFVSRFADAYRLELAAWAAAAAGGSVAGPGSVEGHRANVVAAAGVRSLRTGGRVEVAGD
jgi:myo-inositol 2-dehydrogenase / D-chiro-inositol 1-dehydrogenase